MKHTAAAAFCRTSQRQSTKNRPTTTHPHTNTRIHSLRSSQTPQKQNKFIFQACARARPNASDRMLCGHPAARTAYDNDMAHANSRPSTFPHMYCIYTRDPQVINQNEHAACTRCWNWRPVRLAIGVSLSFPYISAVFGCVHFSIISATGELPSGRQCEIALLGFSMPEHTINHIKAKRNATQHTKYPIHDVINEILFGCWWHSE